MKSDKKLYLVIIGAICLYVAFLLISDIEVVFDKLTNFKIDYLPIILLLTPLGWFVTFSRWNLLLKHFNIHLPFRKNFEIYLTGFALGMTPGKVGELIKSQIYKNNFDVPRKTTAPLILVDRLYSLIGLIIVSLLGINFFEFSWYILIIVIVLVVSVFILISFKGIFDRFALLLKKTKFTSKYSESFSDSYEVVQNSTRGIILFYASSLSAVFWLIELSTVYFILLSFGIDFLDFLNVISIYSTSIILGAASFLPEGIGVMEGSLLGLFTLNGITASVAFPLVIFIRIFTLWYSVIAGFVALKLSGFFSKENIQSK